MELAFVQSTLFIGEVFFYKSTIFLYTLTINHLYFVVIQVMCMPHDNELHKCSVAGRTLLYQKHSSPQLIRESYRCSG